MKTLNTTHKILTTAVLVSLFILFDFSSAQPAPNSDKSSKAVITNTENSGSTAKAPEGEKDNAVTEMFNNARYWVDYLRNTIGKDGADESLTVDSSPEVREMESTPDYWPETLKTIIEQEEASENNVMDTDPDYWIHYLQSTIESENVNS